MRYFLDAEKGGMKIAVPYFNAGNYAVLIDGKVQESTEWDEKMG
jgi:hypothetical protein